MYLWERSRYSRCALEGPTGQRQVGQGAAGLAGLIRRSRIRTRYLWEDVIAVSEFLSEIDINLCRFFLFHFFFKDDKTCYHISSLRSTTRVTGRGNTIVMSLWAGNSWTYRLTV